jgi:hypothetical protein
VAYPDDFDIFFEEVGTDDPSVDEETYFESVDAPQGLDEADVYKLTQDLAGDDQRFEQPPDSEPLPNQE